MNYAKCFCAFCAQPVEFPIANVGDRVPCPGCGRKIPLRLPLLPLGEREAPRQGRPAGGRKVIGAVILAAVMVAIAGLLPQGQLPILLAIVFGGVIYFAPTIMAHGKRNSTAIFLLNLLLGWTFIGWVIALVWAATKDATASAVPISQK